MIMKIKTPDGFSLDAEINLIPGSHKGVIFCHGITVDKVNEPVFPVAVKQLNNAGISTVSFDMRCHGKSSGNSIKDFCASGALTDLKTIYEFVRLKINNLGLVGASFGGSIGSIFAGGADGYNIKALCLINPLLNYNSLLHPNTDWTKTYFLNATQRINENGYIEVGSGKLKIGKKFMLDLERFNPLKELNLYKNQLLFLQGDQDICIDIDDGLILYL